MQAPEDTRGPFTATVTCYNQTKYILLQNFAQGDIATF